MVPEELVRKDCSTKYKSTDFMLSQSKFTTAILAVSSPSGISSFSSSTSSTSSSVSISVDSDDDSADQWNPVGSSTEFDPSSSASSPSDDDSLFFIIGFFSGFFICFFFWTGSDFWSISSSS